MPLPEPALDELRTPPGIPDAEFRDICVLVQQRLGIELRPGKEALVTLRLAEPMRRGGFTSFGKYMEHVKRDPEGPAMLEFIDCLTTNHTNFLREANHFGFWQEQVLLPLRHRAELSVWCAASSSGEEPYTLAMHAVEALGEAAYRQVRILATDISHAVLDQARRGVYAEQRLAPVPEAWRRRYFLRGEGKWQGYYRVRPELMKMVEFRRLNLIEPLPFMGPFPTIFCRNVMIYFNAETRALVVTQMRTRLEPGGYLFVGHAESLNGLDVKLEYVQPSVYRLAAVGRPGGEVERS
jgi:chemotaxis protein methyltransferase CheR